MDIGSNTTRLLVADVSLGGCRPVAQERVFTRLGSALGSDTQIAAGKVAEVALVVGDQVARARALGARRIAVIGTAAVRRAANRDAFCAAVARASAVEPRVLGTEQEARLAFVGATLGMPRGTGPVAVIDVGGGSTEVMVGRVGATGPDHGRQWSLPVGSGLLTDRLVGHDPPTPGEIAALREESGRAFVAAGVTVGAPTRGLAAGGSATSLGRVVGTRLHASALHVALAQLCGAPADRVAGALALHPERVRLLPAGLVLLEAAGRRLGVVLEVAGGGVREGAVCELAGII